LKITIDTTAQTFNYSDGKKTQEFPLYSKEAFELISKQWLKMSWSQKYSYTFTWQGRPMIQLPEDVLRMQEIIFDVKPDLIIETGVAHGGSLIFYAGLCKIMGKGRVIGIDIEIRARNRKAIEDHPMKPFITLIEGSSVDPRTVAQVKQLIKPGEKVLIILDSNHTMEHVTSELKEYHSLVSPGSYLVVTDGITTDLKDVPQNDRYRVDEGPAEAARKFAFAHPEFVLEQPKWRFNESDLKDNITYWPDAWLRKL